MRRLLFTLTFSLTLAATSSALAWTPIASGSPVWRPPVPYYLNGAGSADLGGFDPTLVEVQRAMDDWTRVSCTSLTTTYRGSTSRQPGAYEGTSTIGWIESGWPHGSSAIGVTGPRWGRNIVEADMALNGVNFTWTTGSGSGGRVNTYSIVLHEGGHFYGLGHSTDFNAAMYRAYTGGIDRLNGDDQNGICALYPGAGADCAMTGCPSGQECVAGRCEAVIGDGTICSPCGEDIECGGPSDFCLGYPDGMRYCGRSCGSDADCDGDRCIGTSGGGNQCGRVVGGSVSCTASGCSSDSDCPSGQVCQGSTCRPAGTGFGLGEGCVADVDCATGLCLGSICSQTCNWIDPLGSCPAGFYCDADNSTCDTGYCRAGGAGPGALGAACGADTECSTALCQSGRCSQPCIPEGTVGCPDSYACQVGTLPCRGSCQRTGTLGDDCETNNDCTSGICATTPERNFCTDFCDEDNPCPERFTCTAAGEASVCVPDFGGLGHACGSNEECVSRLCATAGGEMFCTRLCDAATPCPGTFDCVPTSDPSVSACSPTDAPPMDPSGCACRVGRGGASGVNAFVMLGLIGLIWGWRRRR